MPGPATVPFICCTGLKVGGRLGGGHRWGRQKGGVEKGGIQGGITSCRAGQGRAPPPTLTPCGQMLACRRRWKRIDRYVLGVNIELCHDTQNGYLPEPVMLLRQQVAKKLHRTR